MPEDIVITSYSEMAKALRVAENAAAARTEGAPVISSRDKGELILRLHEAMAELRALPDKPGVLVTPRDQFASLLQSAFAESAARSARVKKAPGVSALEAQFDTSDPGWVTVAWHWLRRAVSGRIKYQKPGQTEKLPATARVAVFGDWATGLYGAPVIGRSITNDPKTVDVVLHLGDTYYSGTGGEFEKRFVAFWPQRAEAVSRAVNGNHEMYSGGKAYLKTIREKFGQKSTVFSMANDHWLFIGMDTALDDHSLNDEQLKWIEGLVAGAEGRKVVFFSHHQPFSRLDRQGPKLVAKLQPLLAGKKIFAWYWGHEHHCVLYDRHAQWGLHGRCIGHGGIPEFRDEALGKCPGKPTWKTFEPAGPLPGARILDGPNEFLGQHADRYGPHGYATLTFDGPRLFEEIRDASGQVLRSAELS